MSDGQSEIQRDAYHRDGEAIHSGVTLAGARTVAVLCAATKSVYHSMPGVDVYDVKRDARTFPGGMPVVAHPPCRTWSVHCRQLAKTSPEQYRNEQELGVWCCEQVKTWGGIVEQPGHSLLWNAAGLPEPPNSDSGGFSIEVWQAWWDYPCKKKTWLYMSGINRNVVDVPYRLHLRGGDRRTNQLMSHRQRSETTRKFAEWLVALAREARV